jgi:hypothetical protein
MQDKKGLPLPGFQVSIIIGLMEKQRQGTVSSDGGRCLNMEIPNV